VKLGGIWQSALIRQRRNVTNAGHGPQQQTFKQQATQQSPRRQSDQYSS
jgi:hypothetical protein